MGSHDGAETCELVGCFILNQLTKELINIYIPLELCRDDGLAISHGSDQIEIENTKKQICKIFRQKKLTNYHRGKQEDSELFGH